MSVFFNTLYVTQPEAYLAKNHETVVVKWHGQVLIQIPLHHLASIVCLGSTILVSPELMFICQEKGIAISWLSETGRFQGRVEGVMKGNVLLRRAQYRLADDEEACRRLSMRFIQGKIMNCRTWILRLARESRDSEPDAVLRQASDRLKDCLNRLEAVESMNALRGVEGEAAAVYFKVFGLGLKVPDIHFEGRVRRPPKDPVNVLLSFLYTVLSHDCVAALASVGLDPQVGYLHVDRPGRPSLALDLMEEFRPVLVDRLVIRLFNLKQVQPEDFETLETGDTRLKDAARKVVISEYQAAKKEELMHPLLKQKLPFGLLPLLQARLLAKAIRGELTSYPAFFSK